MLDVLIILMVANVEKIVFDFTVNKNSSPYSNNDGQCQADGEQSYCQCSSNLITKK